MGADMGLVKKIVCILAACIQIIVAAACFYQYDWNADVHYDTSIDSGWAPPKHYDKWDPKDPDDRRNYTWVNYGYFIQFSLFMFGLIALIFAIIEIGLFIVPQFFEFANSMVLRGVVYILVGIAVLGAANDLGIAAGSMSIIIGAVMLILGFIETGFNCKK